MKFIKKYKKYILITLLSILLGVCVYFSLIFGMTAKGLFRYFFKNDSAAGYVCRHLYLVSIIFSLGSLIIVCLFNKIDERMKFISVYASICHIVIFSLLTIISYYVSQNIVAFFSNIVWLIFAYFSLLIFGFTLLMAIKNKENLIEEDDKNIELF